MSNFNELLMDMSTSSSLKSSWLGKIYGWYQHFQPCQIESIIELYEQKRGVKVSEDRIFRFYKENLLVPEDAKFLTEKYIREHHKPEVVLPTYEEDSLFLEEESIPEEEVYDPFAERPEEVYDPFKEEVDYRTLQEDSLLEFRRMCRSALIQEEIKARKARRERVRKILKVCFPFFF